MKKKADSKKKKLKQLKKSDRRIKQRSNKGKKENNKTFSKAWKGCAVTAGVLLAVGYFAVGFYYKDRFLPGTMINGLECGQKPIDEVKEAIKERTETYALTIKQKDEKKEVISGKNIQLAYKDNKDAEKVKEKQNIWRWPSQIFREQKYTINMDSSYDEAALTEVVNRLQCMQDENMIQPQDAKLEDNGTSYVIVPEVQGTALDKEKTAAAIKEAVAQRKTEISLEEAGCYLKPNVLKEDENLKKEAEQLNKMLGSQMTVDFDGMQETITRDMLKSWLKKGEDGSYSYDEALIKEVVIGWSEKYNTYQKPRDFTTAGGYKVHLTGGDFGWRVWQDKTTESIAAALREGQSGTIEATWLHKGQTHGASDIGGTYVEISIQAQTMWFFKNGTCIVQTPVVTGNPNMGNGTPSGGVWRLKSKASPSVLVGRLPDGSIEYETPVQFWMPFNGGVGIHDLSTRSSYGGQIYLYSGSHGCVNTPYDAVKTIYENIEVNTPVVVY